MGAERVKLSDQVRGAVDASGLSRYRLCKSLGMDQATMSRFLNGQGGLSMANLDALADLLQLDVVARGTKGAVKRPRKGR